MIIKNIFLKKGVFYIMAQIYKITFPFRGKVKTQLKITTNKDGSKRLVKPKNVKIFEDAIRIILASAFPIEERPLLGYIKLDMHHYTQYKRDKITNLIVPKQLSDIDNVLKTVMDTLQPIYAKITKLDEEGEPVLTSKGNVSYTKQVVTEGIITDDKYVIRAGLNWIPVEEEKNEKIVLYLTTISEEELFLPDIPSGDIIDLTPEN